MKKPTLFIGLDGPVLIPHKTFEPHLDAGIADYAKHFVHWAKEKFDVRWLTDRSPGQAFMISKHLSLPEDAVSYAGFDVNKTEAIDPMSNFYWVDGALIPSEISWLAEHGHNDRFLPVDPENGVTEEHKKALEMLINKR